MTQGIQKSMKSVKGGTDMKNKEILFAVIGALSFTGAVVFARKAYNMGYQDGVEEMKPYKNYFSDHCGKEKITKDELTGKGCGYCGICNCEK